MTTQLLVPVVVMIRHAQSEWNQQGRFTGWADPPLTEAGRQEAVRAAGRLLEQSYRFDHAYTSRLVRARDTADILLRHSANGDIPVTADWRLNERHYGALQGEDKFAMARLVGEQQVWRWRRGYLDQPPSISADHPDHPARDSRWSDIAPEHLPNAENLADTRQRVMAFWQQEIVPQLRYGRQILISSHGNTLRALIMQLSGMSEAEIESFEIPTGVPIVYAFSLNGQPIGWHYLDDKSQQVA